MEIYLGKISLENGVSKIELDGLLSSTEYDEFMISIREMHELEMNQNLLRIVMLNKKEFISELDVNFEKLVRTSMTITGLKRENAAKFFINLNRLLLNFLSSFRMYLDYSEAHLKRKFGDKSSQVLEFDKMISHYYNNFFSYRFLYKLRNYSQHIELPIPEWDFQTTRNADSSYVFELKIEFDPKYLLDKYKGGWGTVKKDLEKMTEKFNLILLIHELTDILPQIWHNINLLNSDNVSKSAKFIKKKTNHLRSVNVEVCILTNMADKENGNKKSFDVQHIPFHIVDNLNV